MLIMPKLLRAGRSLAFPTVLQSASRDTGANTVAPILTQPEVRGGCPSAQTRGRGSYCQFQSMKFLVFALEDELWFLPC